MYWASYKLEENQRLLLADRQKEWSRFTETFSADKLRRFLQWWSQSQHNYCGLTDFTRFHPTRICIPWCQPPEPLFSIIRAWEPNLQWTPASVSERHQPKPPDCLSPLCSCLGLGPPAVHLHASAGPPETSLHCNVQAKGKMIKL